MMTKSEVADFLQGSTYGAEVDFGSADRRLEMPEGNTWCGIEDYGSAPCGINIDPLLKYNMFGGELQTKACDSESELLKVILDVAEAVIPTYKLPTNRGTIHTHMRIPQLLERPDVLKHLIEYGQRRDHSILRWVNIVDKPDFAAMPTAKQREYYNWHYECFTNVYTYPYHSVAVQRMMGSDLTSVNSMVSALHGGVTNQKAFGFADRTKCRPAINYSHLPTLGTIEFRCFNSTLNVEHLTNILNFSREYITAALLDDPEPEKIFKGREYADNSMWGSAKEDNQVRENKANTCIYVNDFRTIRKTTIRYIALLLINKKLTIKDLNYPKYWIDKGFQ